MFLFSKEHKTPISTYTDSYRPPCTIKKTLYKHSPQPLWRDNKFVTKVNAARGGNFRVSTPTQLQMLAAQDTPACHFCIAEKYKPVFVNEGKYITWRATPYNSAAWNKHCCYLPLLPRVYCACAMLASVKVMGWLLLTLTILLLTEKELVANVPHKLPLYTTTGRGCFHGYYSPWSGRHYWLRGIDYYIDGNSAIRRHLRALGERAVRLGWCGMGWHGMAWHGFRPPMPDTFICPPRWDSTFFMTTGGAQRGSYVIHPEFASEASSALCHW
uniref:Chromosome 9 open reading frame 24 n=1 Tax=Calidris pygmaea TaxID=425635 RepID=A0A8C3PNI8_9CHAR